jgi:hypothetical protein
MGEVLGAVQEKGSEAAQHLAAADPAGMRKVGA